MERLEVRPFGYVKPPPKPDAGPFGDVARPEDVGPDTRGRPQDSVEGAVTRRLADQKDMEQFYNSVGATGEDGISLLTTMAKAGTLGDNEVASQTAAREERRQTFMDAAKSVAGDIGKGIVEAPRQIIGGARDAVQAAVNGIGAVGDWLNNNVADLGTLQLLDEQGNLSPALKPSAGATAMPQLPGVKEATSTTGGLVRGVAQFLTGFVGAGKALGAAAGTGFKAAAAKGAISDFSAFEGAESRLSDLVQDFPALRNPVTEYLSHEGPEDNEAVARLKRATEGLGIGMAAEGLLLGLRAIKAGRSARAAQEAETSPKAPPVEKEAQPLELLGDTTPGAPLTVSKGEAQLELGVPDRVAAQALTDKGLTPLGRPRDGVYVNFARINTADDVKRVIADTAEAFKEQIDVSRRGVRTNVKTVEAAAQEDAWAIIQARRVGEPLNAEQAYAVRQLWEASASKLMEVADVAARVPTPENLYQFRKMLATHYAVQAEAIAARTETARALQSWAIPAGGSKEQMRAIEDMVTRYGGMDVNAELANRVAALKTIPNGIMALDDVVQKGLLAKSLDVVKEVWINALLSGPKTHLVNTMSNSAVAGQQMVETFVASRLSQVIGSGKVPIGEAAAQWNGITNGIREAFVNASKSFATGESGYGMGKIELPRERAISAANMGKSEEGWLGKGIDALGTIVSLPGRALTSADEFYKTIGYRMELHRQAFRTASQEALDGKISKAELKSRMADIVANPPENIRMASVDAATYQTFTQEPGSWVKKLNQLEHDLNERGPAGELGAALTRFLIPFRNTPANIMKYTFERTPVAPLMERYRDAIAQGGAAADMARTRMALGTMTMLLATDLAMDGHLTGSGPAKKEKGEREALYRSGWQPYSVKLNGRYFSYSRMDPIGFTLGLGADLGEYMSNAEFDGSTSLETQKAFTAGAMSIGNNVLSKSYLRGVADFVAALAGSDAQGSNYIEKLGGSFMPTGAAEVARSIDPYMRATHDIISRLQSRTPGMTQDLPLQRDLYGRAKTYESGLGKTYDAVSPIYSRAEKPEPIDQEMMDQSWFVGMPNRKIGSVSLTDRPDVFSRYLELQGQTPASELGDKKLLQKYGDNNLLDTLNGMVTGTHPLSEEYKRLDKGEEREKFVRKVVNAYRKAARERLKEEYPKVFD